MNEKVITKLRNIIIFIELNVDKNYLNSHIAARILETLDDVVIQLEIDDNLKEMDDNLKEIEDNLKEKEWE